jgi:hypothetical protein
MAYELAWTGEGQDGQRFCLGLIDVADLGRRSATAVGMTATDTVASLSTTHGIRGLEAPHSGAIRAGFGPDSGVFRGAENDGISDEMRSFRTADADSAEKALWETVPASDRTVGVGVGER